MDESITFKDNFAKKIPKERISCVKKFWKAVRQSPCTKKNKTKFRWPGWWSLKEKEKYLVQPRNLQEEPSSVRLKWQIYGSHCLNWHMLVLEMIGRFEGLNPDNIVNAMILLLIPFKTAVVAQRFSIRLISRRSWIRIPLGAGLFSSSTFSYSPSPVQWSLLSQRVASLAVCWERKNGCQAELPRGQTGLISSEWVPSRALFLPRLKWMYWLWMCNIEDGES